LVGGESDGGGDEVVDISGDLDIALVLGGGQLLAALETLLDVVAEELRLDRVDDLDG
jgi:hypothetical protein